MKLRLIIFILSVLIVNTLKAQLNFDAICIYEDKVYTNAFISLGYTNFGSDDDPEYAWTIVGERDVNSTIVDDMSFISEGKKCIFVESMELDNDASMLLNNMFIFIEGGNDPDYHVFCTYGEKLDPYYILYQKFGNNGNLITTYCIDLEFTSSSKTETQLYTELFSVIESMNLQFIGAETIKRDNNLSKIIDLIRFKEFMFYIFWGDILSDFLLF